MKNTERGAGTKTHIKAIRSWSLLLSLFLSKYGVQSINYLKTVIYAPKQTK